MRSVKFKSAQVVLFICPYCLTFNCRPKEEGIFSNFIVCWHCNKTVELLKEIDLEIDTPKKMLILKFKP